MSLAGQQIRMLTFMILRGLTVPTFFHKSVMAIPRNCIGTLSPFLPNDSSFKESVCRRFDTDDSEEKFT
jgi:hypothetical protein